MARIPTTFDPFNAVAEPKRRKLLEVLAGKELSVTQIVELLEWSQPTVSKHLGVLKQVGLVLVRHEGRLRVYRVNATQLKPIHDWVGLFEKHWSDRFDQLDDYLSTLQTKDSNDE